MKVNTGSTSNRIGIIGGSDIGAILGVSNFSTPLDIYNNFLGNQQEDPTPEQMESMAMGTFFEDTICKYHANKRGWKIRRSNLAYQHEKYPWFVLHPDRIIVGKVDIDGNPLPPDSDEKGYKAAIECKYVSNYSKGWGEPGTDEVPDYILAQCVGYFLCKVCDVVYVIRLQGNRIDEYVVRSDEELNIQIEQHVVEFYENHLKSKIPPEPITEKDYKRLYKYSNAEKVVASDYAEKLVNQRKQLKDKAKVLNQELKEVELELMDILKDKSYLVNIHDEKLLSWKTQTSNRFNQKLFKEKHPDLYEQFKTSSVSRVMR